MSAPKFCECGARIQVVVKTRGVYSHPHAVKGHDLCETCWKDLLARSVERESRYRFGVSRA